MRTTYAVEPESKRRRAIREELICAELGGQPFTLKECPTITALIIKADGLDRLPAEQQKRLISFHEQELKKRIGAECTLIDSISAVERYIDSLPDSSAGKAVPFADHLPKLEEKR